MSVFPKDPHERIRALVLTALLTASEIVLSRFLSFSQWNVKFSLAFLPVALAACLYGPLVGALTGALSDFLGAILFPIGTYFVGFTLTAALVGAAYGVCLHEKKITALRALCATAFSQVVGTLLLNTLWIYLLYAKSGFAVLLISRLPEFGVMGVVTFLCLYLLLPRLSRVLHSVAA